MVDPALLAQFKLPEMPPVGLDPEVAQLAQLIQACQSIASTKDRTAVFAQHAQPIQALVALIYDPFQKFHVTSKSLAKFEKVMGAPPLAHPPQSPTLQALLRTLAKGSLTGHAALREIQAFLASQRPEHGPAIRAALDKDLKIKVGVQLVNQAFPGLVPVFSVALSYPIETHQRHYDKNRDFWWISRKLDGCRCLFVRRHGTTTAYSRSGHVFPAHIPGLSSLLQQFRDVPDFPDGYVVDGEMGVVNDAGQEFFNAANALMNPNATADPKKRAPSLLTPEQYLCYFAFDWISWPTFAAGEGPPKWRDRQHALKQLLPIGHQIRILEQHPGVQLDALWRKVEKEGWEGLILRLDEPYEGKKSRSMLKMKQQADAEFVIEEATSSLQLPPTSTEPTLALEHVGVAYQGRRVWVGSGFTWEQRLQYAAHPEALVGKHVTVKHYGATVDKTGQPSLRHPTVKCLWLEPRQT